MMKKNPHLQVGFFIFLLAAIAGTKHMPIAAMDVPGAYLKASMPMTKCQKSSK